MNDTPQTRKDEADEMLLKAHLRCIIGEAILDHAKEVSAEAAERFRQTTGEDVSNVLPEDE